MPDRIREDVYISERPYENLRAIGKQYEQIAAAYLQEHGYLILDRNYYTRRGELDLICREWVRQGKRSVPYLVFVEVKYRSSRSYGYAEEAVTAVKCSRMMKSAQIYMKHHGISFSQPVRFDILAIDGREIRLIRNAFGGM